MTSTDEHGKHERPWHGLATEPGPHRPEQCGMTKTEAAAQTLGGINPDVALEPYTMNITTVQGYDAFKASITDPATGAFPNKMKGL